MSEAGRLHAEAVRAGELKAAERKAQAALAALGLSEMGSITVAAEGFTEYDKVPVVAVSRGDKKVLVVVTITTPYPTLRDTMRAAAAALRLQCNDAREV